MLPRMKRYCQHDHATMQPQRQSAFVPRQCLSCQRRERLCAAERIIQYYLPLLVSQTPSLGSDASPPLALLKQLSYPWKLHACRANHIYFLCIFILFFALYIWYWSQLYYTEQYLLLLLRQMHQIIHLSPVGCFSPAQGKTIQKNREVSDVK